MIEAGKLNKRIELQRKTETTDSVGGVSESFATYKTVWARIVGGGGGERLVGQQVTGRGGLVIQIRYRTPEPTILERVKLGSTTYDINDVDNVEYRNRELLLTCTEVVGNG